jgi:D-serine deaminase-like pyridoxal phosphate-dependent protein
MANDIWYRLRQPEKVTSPSLLIYPDRIKKNIETMLSVAGGPDKLRPHIKTHKTAEIIEMQLEAGITKFKCATIAEAELLATCGVTDILLAMQPVGPNLDRFLRLMHTFPQAHFATLVDHPECARIFSEKAGKQNKRVALYLDLNTGMNRTGITPGREAIELYQNIAANPNLIAMGLHAYDGHIREKDAKLMKERCDAGFEAVQMMRNELENRGIMVPTVIAGGSPSFPIHAGRPGTETSPGTTLLWDATYSDLYNDPPFLPAAVLLTRIISKPGPGIVCLDLGHKSIAPEMAFPRAIIFGMEHCRQIAQSEEHLVLECPKDLSFEIGDVYYAIPMHVCPTVAKYPSLITVSKGEITGRWLVAARDHSITI